MENKYKSISFKQAFEDFKAKSFSIAFNVRILWLLDEKDNVLCEIFLAKYIVYDLNLKTALLENLNGTETIQYFVFMDGSRGKNWLWYPRFDEDFAKNIRD